MHYQYLRAAIREDMSPCSLLISGPCHVSKLKYYVGLMPLEVERTASPETFLVLELLGFEHV
eukprot:11871185-Heterocapsa_arctica.AAC.1